jgi:hypothetical protein
MNRRRQAIRRRIALRAASTTVNVAPIITAISVDASDPSLLVGNATYFDANGDVRATPKPSIAELTIVGGAYANAVNSATFLYSNLSNISAGTHLYKWYLANDVNGTGATVDGTSSTYTPNVLNVGKFLDLELTPVSSDGTTGVPVRAGYIAISNPFDPSNLGLAIDARPSGAVNVATNQYWQNAGSAGNLTKDGSIALPTYNGTENAMEFTSASIQDLLLPNPTYTKPVVIWLRVKLKGTAVQTWLGFNGSHHVRYNSGVTISGVTVAGTTLTTAHWYILRVEISASASSSKLKIDDNAEITGINASTNGITSGTGRVGSQSVGGSQYGNCYISHIFVKNGAVSDSDKGLMDTWFANNAPHT